MGDFNTPLTSIDRSSRQKINKETQTLNDTLDQMGLIDIYRAFHLKAAEYTFFSSAHGTFSRIDHMLGHKQSLNKFRKTEIISRIFSNHNAMRLEINHKKKKLLKTKTHGGYCNILFRKIPHAAEQLNPCATNTEPACLEPVLCSKRSHRNEKPSATRESPRTAMEDATQPINK